jgi:hypothetical protein
MMDDGLEEKVAYHRSKIEVQKRTRSVTGLGGKTDSSSSTKRLVYDVRVSLSLYCLQQLLVVSNDSFLIIKVLYQ